MHSRRGHLKQSENGEGVVREMMEADIDVPQETAFLVTLDQLQDEKIKESFRRALDEAHAHRLSISTQAFERAEARADREADALIRRREVAMWIAAVLFVLVLVAFVVAIFLGASAAQLWAFAVFFLGPVGVFALGRGNAMKPDARERQQD